jgi:hypothetical protein
VIRCLRAGYSVLAYTLRGCRQSAQPGSFWIGSLTNETHSGYGLYSFVPASQVTRSNAIMFRLSEISSKHSYGPRVVAVLAIVVIGSILTMNPVDSYSAEHQATAHATRTLNARITAHLHLVLAEGSELFEEGPVSGALTGSMRAELRTGAVFTGSFTTHVHGGSIDGHGRATPHGSGRYQSFSGSFVVTGGSGRYVHAKGRAGLYGVFDRRSDSVVVQTTGKLSY